MATQKLERELQTAKDAVIDRLGDVSWLRSVGIGLVGRSPGLVVSVATEGESKARAELEALRLSVPASVRVVGPVRARLAGRARRDPGY